MDSSVSHDSAPSQPIVSGSSADAEATVRPRPSLRPGPNPLTIALLGLFGILIVLVAAFIFYQMSYADRIYPGVQVDGVDLGGYTRAEARARLAEHVAQYTDAKVTFRYGDQTWQTTLAEAGAVIDPNALLTIAYSMGRSGSPVQMLRKQSELFFQAQSADLPKLGFDPGARRAFIGRLTKEIDRPAIPSRVELTPDLKVVVTPSQVGRELQVEPALTRLAGTVDEVIGKTYDLPVTEEQPKVKEADLEPVRARLATMIGSPLTLQSGTKSWPLSPAQIAGLIDLSAVAQGETNPDRAIRVDSAKLQPTLDSIAKDLKVDPVNGKVQWQDGRAQIREPGQNGQELEVEPAKRAILDRLTSNNRTVALPVVVTEPLVSEKTLPSLGLKELVKRTETSFAGSALPRAHNVRLAASRLDNQLVMPGEVFSFNQALGPTTLDTGWQVGYGIEAVGAGDHKTVPSVAGGICQVATTLFQSVFWAGYQIEERYYHLYWIESYGLPPDGMKGLDATVDSPAVDVQFKNTTDKPILIHAGTTDNDRVFFELYSTKPTWKVTVDPPKITNVQKADFKMVIQEDPTLPAGQTILVEHAVDGFDAEIVRRVQEGTQEPRVLKLTSRYVPSNNVTLVGTKGRPAGVTPAQPSASATPRPNEASPNNANTQPEATPAANPPAGPATGNRPATGAAPRPTQAPLPTLQPIAPGAAPKPRPR